MQTQDSRPISLLHRLSLDLAGWVLLFLVDLVVLIFGFGGLCALIARFPTLSRSGGWGRIVRAVRACEAVDAARVYYFKRAWCLQSAAAATLLCRIIGSRADLVIGVWKVPFYAHAWVEVEGQVLINDRPKLRELHKEIARL